MDLWYHEEFVKGLRVSFKVTRTLYHGQSPYQKIDIIETERFGRVLLLDGLVMYTTSDEYVYHEMLVHPSLLAHPNPKRVCVVGGGDGGTIREILKHPEVESVVLCEIDEEVIRVCKEFFPNMAEAFSDPRVTVNIGDAAEYIRTQHQEFDIIYGDTTDPIGPAVVLFEEPFYVAVKKALKPKGIFIAQIESVFLHGEIIPKVTRALKKCFHDCRLYGASIPTYPTGYWNFVWASDDVNPFEVDSERQRRICATSRYYTAGHQRAAFTLPAFAAELLA
jgi:spermidine synthase